MRVAVLALAAAVVAAAVALAASDRGPEDRATGDGRALRGPSPGDAARRRELVRRSQALVSVSPAALGYRLVLAPPRPGVRADTDRRLRTIRLYVGADEPAHRVAHDLAHELGHAYDDRHMTRALRRRFLARRGVTGAPWWPRGRFSDYTSGAGDFAEVFALCHSASPEFRSRLAARPPDPCALLPREARRIPDRDAPNLEG